MRLAAAAGGLIAVLHLGIASAADRVEVGPVPEWVAADSVEAAVPKASEAPLQVLLSEQQLRITTDAVDTYVATRVRIQSPQGLGAVGTLSLVWKPDSDVLTVHEVSILRDGKKQDLLGSGDTFTILRREDQLEQATLTGALTAVLQPPGLQVGDVVSMSYTLRRKDPVVADTPSELFAWPAAPIVRARFRAIWPEQMKMQWRATKHMPAAEPVKRDGWMELDYKADNLVPLLQPRGAPDRFAALRLVELTTFADWTQLSQRLEPLFQKTSKLEANSPLRAEAARIRQQHATPVARAAAALQLVQDQIRYVLLTMNDGGLMPAAADETWRRRYGDCKAKTVLLMALLRELGIESEPVLVSTRFADGLDQRLPMVGLFDHVLVKAQIQGKTYWLDGTRTGDRSLAQLRPPPYIWALPLVAKGSALLPIPREPYDVPQVQRSLFVDAVDGIDSSAPFRAEMIMRGDYARALKNTWDAVPAENRTEGLQAFWREQYHNLTVEKTDTKFDEIEGVLTWTASGRIMLEFDPQYRTYEPNGMDLGYRADLTRPAGTDADAPYAVQFPMYVRSTETIALPPQAAPFTLVGTDIKQTIAGVEYMRKASVVDGRFTVEVTERSVAVEFPASERAETERRLLEMSRNNLHLKKPNNYLPTVTELRAQAGKPADTAEAYATRGSQMMSRGLIPEARIELDKALSMDPKLATARRPLASLALSEGRPQEVLDLMAPIENSTSQSWDQMLRARALQRLGKTEEALKITDAVIQADPKYGDAYRVKTDLLQLLNRREEIPPLAEAMLKATGSDTGSLLSTASLLSRAGFRDQARAVLDEALAKEGGDASKQGRAFIYLSRAQLQDTKAASLADTREARKLETSDGMTMQVASLFMLKRWYPEALDVMATIPPQNMSPDWMSYRGIARWHLKQPAAAEDFRNASAQAGGSGLLNNMCWAMAVHNAALPEALKQCDAALAKQPDCGPCMDSRAFVLLRMNRLQEALTQYDASLTRMPQSDSSLYGRGIVRIRMGQREAGEADLKAARQIAPYIDRTYEESGVIAPSGP